MNFNVSEFSFGGMKFKKAKFDAMDGSTMVTWTEDTIEKEPFTAKANRGGVWFEGRMHGEIYGEKDLEKFANFIAIVWEDHRKLKPVIHRTLTGHEPVV